MSLGSTKGQWQNTAQQWRDSQAFWPDVFIIYWRKFHFRTEESGDSWCRKHTLKQGQSNSVIHCMGEKGRRPYDYESWWITEGPSLKNYSLNVFAAKKKKKKCSDCSDQNGLAHWPWRNCFSFIRSFIYTRHNTFNQQLGSVALTMLKWHADLKFLSKFKTKFYPKYIIHNPHKGSLKQHWLSKIILKNQRFKKKLQSTSI